MAALTTISSRIKGIVILLAYIVGLVHQSLQAVVRIVDDSVITTEEALGFVMAQGAVGVGEWRKHQQQAEQPSNANPSDGTTTTDPVASYADQSVEDKAKAFAQALADEAAAEAYKKGLDIVGRSL